MNYLRSGATTQAKFDLLLSGTSIKSENIIMAMRYYLVTGLSMSRAAELAEVLPVNLSRSLKTLNEVAAIVEKCKELDWHQFKAEQSAILLAK